MHQAASTLIYFGRLNSTRQMARIPHRTAISKVMSCHKSLVQKKTGRTRCVELGPSPSDLGGQKPTRVEAIKMVSEANAEIRDMKEKMTVMEQTRAQMAAMMSSMQRNIPDNNVPDMIAITSDASGHSVPQQVITGANSPWRFNASDADMSEQKKNLEYKEHSSMQRCLFMHFGLHICLGGLTVVCVLMGFELDLLTTGCMPDMLSYFEL